MANTKIYSKVLLVSLSLMIRDYKEVTISAFQVLLEQNLLSLPVMNILGCYRNPDLSILNRIHALI